ncbi:MAG: class I SAM-dependent methyltransferase, partial [Deltaproteobacteria bacterium]|nr:class I SAM-dependent methyltransferase [Deltaproteobacteria bacterium]
ATARLKAKGIDAMGHRENFCLIAEDLSERKLVDVLKTNESWDQSARTVIIAEGLLMYLPPEAVRDLFSQCDLITGVGSRIAFSYIPSGTDGRLDAGRWTGLMLWLQKVAGEPWLWSIHPDKLGPFLAETGWKNDSEEVWLKQKYGVEFYAKAAK